MWTNSRPCWMSSKRYAQVTQLVQGQKDVIYQTRIDVATIERMEKESSGSSMKSLLEDTARIEKEFRKLSEIEGGSV